MKKLLVFLCILCLSCSSNYNSGDIGYTTKPSQLERGGREVRVVILENNTSSYIILTGAQASTLRWHDTVWVDLATHTINDTSNTAMKAVIEK